MKLLYLSNSRYGGWVTFTTHLYHGLIGKKPSIKEEYQSSDDYEVIRPTQRTEKPYRNMGNYVPYKNMNEEDILALEQPILITAMDKHHRELGQKLLEKGATIVIHDPTELRNPKFREFINPRQVIVIRKTMLQHMEEATFIPHPYMASDITDPLDHKEWMNRQFHAINIARLDFDKNSHWLLEANRVLSEERQIEIRGAENRMYTKNKILSKYDEYTQDSHRPKDNRAVFKLEFRGAVNLCRKARYMTDFSVISKDGGGTQYTFLEAIDAGTICLLHRDWIKPNDSMVDEGTYQNCISFSNWEQLAHFLKGHIQTHIAMAIRTSALKLLKSHDAIKIANIYKRKING